MTAAAPAVSIAVTAPNSGSTPASTVTATSPVCDSEAPQDSAKPPVAVNEPVFQRLLFAFPADVASPKHSHIRSFQRDLAVALDSTSDSAATSGNIAVPQSGVRVLLRTVSVTVVAMVTVAVFLQIVPMGSPQPTNTKAISYNGLIAIFETLFSVLSASMVYELFLRTFFDVAFIAVRSRLIWTLVNTALPLIVMCVAFSLFGCYPFNVLPTIFICSFVGMLLSSCAVPELKQIGRARLKRSFDYIGVMNTSIFAEFAFLVLFFTATEGSAEQQLVPLANGAFIFVWRLVTVELALKHNFPLTIRILVPAFVAVCGEVAMAFSLAKIDQPATFAIFFAVQFDTPRAALPID